MSSNRKNGNGSFNRNRRGHRGSGDASADNFDEFGIMRATEKSSDSAPIDDPSLHLTDEDTSAQVLETVETSDLESPVTKDHYRTGTTSDSEPIIDFSNASGNVGLSDFRSQIEDLAADFTGGSEDFSKASDGHSLKKKTAASNDSSQHQDETESLTEFEEIERLIQANTVADSDDDLSDIPQDLEQKVLSGRKSRESNKSDTRSEVRTPAPNDHRNHHSSSSSSTTSSSSSEKPEVKQSELLNGLYHDTGYASEGVKTPGNTPGPSFVQNKRPDTPVCTGEDSADDSIAPLQSWLNDPEDEPLHSTGRIPTQENFNNLFTGARRVSSSSSSEIEEELTGTNDNLGQTADRFVVPTQRADTHQPNSLVATFGTTEEFRDLLIQQLDDMGTEEIVDEKPDQNDAKVANDNEERQSVTATKRKKLPQQPLRGGTSPNRSRTSPRTPSTRVQYQMKPQSRNKLKLSPNNKQSPRDNSGSSEFGKSSAHSTRSPAASRARRKNNPSNGRRSTALNRESSTDEMSIHSDISRTELKSKLKEEALSRKREEELVRELQSNYDSLLMKFAQAENTIDHLRLGAKINIFASVPRPSPEDPTLPFEEGQIKHQQQSQDNQNIPEQQVNPSMLPGNHYRQSSGGSFAPSGGSKRDSIVESSLQFPAAATTEFLKVALQLQAKDLQNKINDFNTLMDNMQLDSEELKQAMDYITEALHNLEQDYLNAIDEHAAEQKKHMLATGGSVDQCQQFDPDRIMERDIGRLGDQVNDLRARVNNQQRSPEPVSARSRVTESEVPSSPEGDVDNKFNQLLHKYNRSTLTDDGHTTAPSQYVSSHDEEEFSPRPLSNRYLEPASAELDTSVTSQTPRTPVESPKAQPRRQRYQSSFSSMGESIPSTSPSPTRRSHSRLPRPVGKGGKERRAPSRESKKSQQTDKGTDSGFVGSESSRQSTSATPLQPTRIKLVQRPPTAVEVQSPSQPKPTEKRDRAASGDTTSTMTTADRIPTNRSAPQTSYIDRVVIYKPPNTHDDSFDDLSTTSTVREALRPRHHSHSCSTSTAPSQATTIRRPQFGGFPHGSKSGASLKSRDSGKRSVASSMRDSTLDAIRGEISRLRGEINAAKAQEKENLRPAHTSTPRRTSNGRNSPAVSDSEHLQAIRHDIKALKDELQRKGPKKSTDVDDLSLKSADLTTGRSRDTERGRRSRRSRSLGRDDASETSTHRNDTSPEVEGRRRRRSRSQTRNPWQGGYWTYVPPAPLAPPVWGTSQPPMGRTYQRATSPVAPVYPQMVHTAPVIGPPPSMIYMEPQAQTMGPVYIPAAPRQGRFYTTPSKPKASVYISPSRGRSGNVRKASVYIVESDGEEQPLRRSHLNLRRSSSLSRIHTKPSSLVVLPDSRLNDSIERAERSAENLRSHSRQMYRSVRDDLYRTQLMADTM